MKKRCGECSKLLDFGEFYKNSKCKFGLKSYCKSCAKIKARKYKEENGLEISFRLKAQRKKNKAKNNAYNAQWGARKARRSPPWVTENDLLQMWGIYELARIRTERTGTKWCVDHILPLRGKIISGLHVPENLQVITLEDNATKNNIF